MNMTGESRLRGGGFLGLAMLLALGGCGNDEGGVAAKDSGPADQGTEVTAGDLSELSDLRLTPLDMLPQTCAPCTDVEACCNEDEIVCVGDPDGQIVCSCAWLWDCTAGDCQQPLNKPDEQSGWSCSWSAEEYLCEKQCEMTPNAGSYWSCSLQNNICTCQTQTPPNPCNSEAGLDSWTCQIDGEYLTCSEK